MASHTYIRLQGATTAVNLLITLVRKEAQPQGCQLRPDMEIVQPPGQPIVDGHNALDCIDEQVRIRAGLRASTSPSSRTTPSTTPT